DVHPPEQPFRLRDQRLARGFLRDVSRDELGLDAKFPQVGQSSRRLRRVTPRDDDVRAERGDPFGHAQSDAAIAPGDDGDLAFEVEQIHRDSPRQMPRPLLTGRATANDLARSARHCQVFASNGSAPRSHQGEVTNEARHSDSRFRVGLPGPGRLRGPATTAGRGGTRARRDSGATAAGRGCPAPASSLLAAGLSAWIPYRPPWPWMLAQLIRARLVSCRTRGAPRGRLRPWPPRRRL